jgi:hypothetical protein
MRLDAYRGLGTEGPGELLNFEALSARVSA